MLVSFNHDDHFCSKTLTLRFKCLNFTAKKMLIWIIFITVTINGLFWGNWHMTYIVWCFSMMSCLILKRLTPLKQIMKPFEVFHFSPMKQSTKSLLIVYDLWLHKLVKHTYGVLQNLIKPTFKKMVPTTVMKIQQMTVWWHLQPKQIFVRLAYAHKTL